MIVRDDKCNWNCAEGFFQKFRGDAVQARSFLILQREDSIFDLMKGEQRIILSVRRDRALLSEVRLNLGVLINVVVRKMLVQ